MNRQTKVLALILAVLPAALFAQSAAGLPAFGSFSGGTFDTINNGHPNVYFQIPIASKAGRGLPFTYTLNYKSSVWYLSGGVWTPVKHLGLDRCHGRTADRLCFLLCQSPALPGAELQHLQQLRLT